MAPIPNAKLTSSGYDIVRAPVIEKAPGVIDAPRNVITTVAGARTIYYQYRADSLKRITLYAQIEGLIAGNPPYNPVELQRQGLSHIANFNNLDGRSLYERSALAYWNLLNEAETLITFELLGIEGEGSENVVAWATTMAKNWTDVIRRWPSFTTQFNTLSAQIIKFGISPIIWPDEQSWKWRTVELSRFFIPDQALTDIEQLTSICIETTFTVQYLYEVYEAFKDKKKEDSPWNIEELGRFIVSRANSYAKREFDIIDMMDLQVRLQNGDIGFNQMFSDSVRVISLLYKEYDGGISHYMFDRVYGHQDFIYFVDRQYKTMNEALVIFTASPGEFTIHSNRGVGHKIFAGCQATMQLDCDIVNGARLASTPLIKSLATGAKDFEAIRFYPGVPTNIGTAEFVQNTFGSNLDQLLQVSQYINQKLQYNTANSGDDPGTPDRNVGSVAPSQFRMESFKEFGVLKHNIAHFYSQFDIVVRNMVAKMWHSKKGYADYDEAKEWKDLCIQDGVPEAIFALKNKDEDSWKLPRHLKASATRVAGDGSTLSILMGLQELAADVNAFGPKGQKQYLRQKVAAVFGPAHVKAYITPEEPDEVAGGASLAGVENAIMQNGQSPVFSPDNEQRAHFVTHLALGNDTIQRIQQQQMDPVAADKIFTVLVPHMEEHWNAMINNPYLQSFIESVKQPWDQLAEYSRLNRKNAESMIKAQIQKQQEQQEKQERVLSDIELKNLQVTSDEKRKDLKVISQVERAKEANATRAEIMREKAIRDSDNQRLKIGLDSQNKTIENNSLEENREALASMNGVTIAPSDIEPPVR